MKSKISWVNSTIYWKNIKRFWPLWVGYLLVLLVRFPWILYNWAVNNVGFEKRELIYVLLSNGAAVDMIMILIASVICAMALWSYLYFPKSSTWAHALPVKRSTLFITNVLSGLSMLIVPILAAYGIGIGVATALDLPFVGLIGQWMFILTGVNILFFGMATLLAMMTGNIIVLPVLYFIFQFVGLFLYAILQALKNILVYGNSNTWDTPDWLSPIAAVLERIGLRSDQYDIQRYGESIANVIKPNYYVYGQGTVVIGAVIGVLLLIGAYQLYRKHHTEKYGDTISVKWIRPVMKYGFILCFAFLMTICLYQMGLIDGMVRSADRVLVVTIVLLWISGFMGYFIAEMLLQKSFRVFHGKDFIRGIIYNLVIALPVLALGLDLFGYTRWVPEAHEVESVIISNGNGILQDVEIMEEIIDVHQKIVDNRKLYMDREIAMGNVWDDRGDIQREDFLVEYRLKNGKVRNRAFEVWTTQAERLQEGVYQDMYHLMNQPKVIYAQYFSDDFDMTHINDITVDCYDASKEGQVYRSTYTISNNDRKRQLYEAMVRDIGEGRLKVRQYYENKGIAEYMFTITAVPMNGNQSIYTFVEIDKNATSTYAFLKKMEKLYNQ